MRDLSLVLSRVSMPPTNQRNFFDLVRIFLKSLRSNVDYSAVVFRLEEISSEVNPPRDWSTELRKLEMIMMSFSTP